MEGRDNMSLRLPINKPSIETKYTLNDEIEVVLGIKAYLQIQAYMEAQPKTEICLLAPVEREGMTFTIPHFYFLKQVGSGSSTEIDEDALAELFVELIGEGKEKEAENMKCWFHTHPTMSDFWSATDVATCDALVVDWFVAIVAGTSGLRVRLDMRLDGFKIVFDKVPLTVSYPLEDYEELAESYRKEAKEKVETFKPKPIKVLNANDKQVEKDRAKKNKKDKKNGKGSGLVETYCRECGIFHPKDEECDYMQTPEDTTSGNGSRKKREWCDTCKRLHEKGAECDPDDIASYYGGIHGGGIA
jgi:proteasome lid subunit RPN8/RPN11